MKATGEKPTKPTGSARPGTPAGKAAQHGPNAAASSTSAATAQTVAETADTATVPTSDRPALGARDLRMLQGAVGNRAVSRLVAQRYTAPVKTPAAQAPGFRRVKSDVAAK
ncbi:hypothetical protein, partial [Streptomyces palmae]